MKPVADQDVDRLYRQMREQHGAKKAGANGYRSHKFFLREQRLLLQHTHGIDGPILDIACGSGLMLQPLYLSGQTVTGLDFNEDACKDARQNGMSIIQGDAFELPFANSTFSAAVNCQFLNQQPAAATQRFVEEACRVLQPGGKLIILWRHADSWLHKTAHRILRTLDSITNAQPEFPQYANPLSDVAQYAKDADMQLTFSAVTLPMTPIQHVAANGAIAGIAGASLFAIFEKSGR